MRILTIALLVLASGCSSNPDKRSILDRVEFGEDEVGCFRVTGTIGGSAFTSSNAAVILVKKKGGDDAPDC